MMTRIINENKGKLNLHSLENMFGSRLTSKMIRKYQFTNNKFLRRYAVVERRYAYRKVDMKKIPTVFQTHNGWRTRGNYLYGLALYFAII